MFDFVGDMRDNLYGFAEIIATAFLVDYGLEYASGCHIVGAGGQDISETFVVTEVEVRFMTIDRDITFAVFVGIQGSRVDVDVGVKLLDCNTVAS